MPHEDELNDLKIGGWVREPRPSTALMPYRPRATPRPATSTRARQVLLACGAAIVAGVAGVMALIVTAGDEPPGTGAQQLAYPSYEPLTPVSLLPAPASSSAAPPPVIATHTTPVAEHTTKTSEPAPWRTTPSAPPLDLVAGATIGLEVDGRPDVRLRHRNFVARAEQIRTASSSLDKADFTFVVRNGLARASCVSFESANFPGYFLRHRAFILRLEQRNRQENSELFSQDATFCPAPAGNGSSVFLESINYPNRAVHLRDDNVFHLDEGAGTALVVRPPLS
jgi:Alpha-L-arabinofuranosidase B (ABFB) domain